MNFENREIDDKKLMDEIDELESDFTPKVKAKIIEEKEEAEAVSREKSPKYNIAIILLLILVICAYLCYEKFIKNNYNYNYDDYSYEEYEEIVKKNEDEFNKQRVNVETNVTVANNTIIVEVNNNNDSPIFDADIYLVYYDENHKAIDVSYDQIDYILPGGKEYFEFGKIKNSYETYDVVVTKSYFSIETPVDLSDKIGYGDQKNDEKIVIKAKNESDSEIDMLKYQIVYFDEEKKIVGFEDLYEYDLTKGKKFELSSYGPYDKETYESIEYAGYEVNLVYARKK